MIDKRLVYALINIAYIQFGYLPAIQQPKVELEFGGVITSDLGRHEPLLSAELQQSEVTESICNC